MLLQSPWAPRLADIEANAAERLVLALADDIIEGRLAGGDRLPAHRDLAWKLGVGLGTVTKAYAVLERRGLTRSVKGRGTFVAIQEAHGERQIDLSSNAPPATLSARILAKTLTGIARRIDADHFNLYAPPGGHVEHRRILARWLETLGLSADPSHLVLTSGGRQALALAFQLACGPGGLLLTERITYPGAIALARRNGCRLQGLEIDTEGMMPEALAAALDATSSRGRVAVYLTPTLHNPTTVTMGVSRRQAIVDICRRAGVWIVEDGVYAASDPGVVPLAALAPDISFHVNGLSKSLGPGLQIGLLTLPPGLEDAAKEHLQDMPMAPSALSCAVVEDWLTTGVISSIQRDLRHEARRRSGLAVSLLAMRDLAWHPDAYNVWLPMERGAASRLVAEAMTNGIRLTAPDALMVDAHDQASGLRLCLGGPSFDDLTAALTVLSRLLKR
ncbi:MULTISPECIES: PLP-dependent aminotransferase family protein [unclassified Rhizobium]|jgi:DNA-binding transcriptional MocR family regulator|uniref:aminotransferase-like domain-containing protein n=1 Tax=unclassified Rhizobium TaxID=2613769 RepID=UPI000646C88B|nr:MULTISPECIES: PLP-dependent aminotransferase family protein [unclassified Rhizobium]OJY71768.1 MAG: aspartate aminotransferase [Rhizobium sp. 60-20]RKD35468.1 GntR family transcriptional regulator [Rhizobium sp. WW_1]